MDRRRILAIRRGRILRPDGGSANSVDPLRRNNQRILQVDEQRRVVELEEVGGVLDISVHPDGGKVEILAAFANGFLMSTNAGGSFAAVRSHRSRRARGHASGLTVSSLRQTSPTSLARRPTPRSCGDGLGRRGRSRSASRQHEPEHLRSRQARNWSGAVPLVRRGAAHKDR